jgi:hypothetical protein
MSLLFALLLLAPSRAPAADGPCPVPHSRVTVCWSDPKVRVGRADTLAVVTNPKSYDFLLYGNPVSGVLLTSDARRTRLLMRRGRLYIELDPLSAPDDAALALDRFLRLAGDVWDVRHDFIDAAQIDPSTWLVSSSRGWHSFRRLETSEPAKGAAADDAAKPAALKDLPDEDIIRRLEKIAPVKVNGKEIHILGRRIGALTVLGKREELDDESKDLYDELTNRFRK